MAVRTNPLDAAAIPTYHGKNMKRSAIVSACGQYRYRLKRSWDPSLPSCMFIMLNPSTADHEIDDPTITRCIDFAQAWGCGTLYVGNLFAFRATEPKKMKAAADPVGPNNKHHLRRVALKVARSGGICVAAWGSHGGYRDQDKVVLKWFRAFGVQLHYLKLTKKLVPRHPLYLKGNLKPTPWNP